MERLGQEDDLPDRRSVVAAEAVARSYAIALPAGWMHIPVLDRDSMLDLVGTVATAPDEPGWRAAVGTQFDTALASDPDHRLLDTYMTQGPIPTTAIAANITVAKVEVTASSGHSPEELLLARMARGRARVRSVGGSVCVVDDAPLDPDEPVKDGVQVLARQTALVQVPGNDTFLLGLVFTVVSAVTDEHGLDAVTAVVRSLTELFDALLGTFRWLDGDGTVMSAADRGPA